MRTSPITLLALPLVLSSSPALADDSFSIGPRDGAPSTETPLVREPAEPVAPDRAAPAFGERGQLVLSGTALGGVSRTTYDGSDAKRTTATFNPGLDYFIARRVSLGVVAYASYSDSLGYGADGSLVDTTSWSVSGGLRLGYVVPLGDSVSFWPMATLGLSYYTQHLSIESGSSLSTAASAIGAADTRRVGPYVSLYAPILLHVAPHLFVGFGPTFSHSFAHSIANGAASSASAESTSIGAGLTVGGYWGGSGPAALATDRVVGRVARFGDAGRFVITNDLDLGVSHVGYSGTGSSTNSVTLVPSFDVFVVPHVTLGVEALVSRSSARGLQPDGSTVDSSRTSLALGPRIGAALPLADDWSWWPRVGVVFGEVSYSESSAGRSNDNSLSTVTVHAAAPVLFHLAPRFFAGLGPTLSWDLSGKVDDGRDLKATSFGVSGLLGGWL